MYKRKLTPEEALQEIKLRMRYDSSKTLNENLMVTEQVDKSSQEYKIASEFWNSVGGAGTNPEKLRNAIAKIDSVDLFNKVNKQVAAFNQKMDIPQWINDDLESDNAFTVKFVVDHLKKLGINATAEFNAGGDFVEKTFKLMTGSGNFAQGVVDTAKAVVDGAKNVAKDVAKSAAEASKQNKDNSAQKTPVQTVPPELKDVKAFQDWLDGKYPGWADGYKDGKLNKGVQNAGFKSGGYGTFGKRTKAAWEKYKDKFLGGGENKSVDVEGDTQSVLGMSPDEFLNQD